MGTKYKIDFRCVQFGRADQIDNYSRVQAGIFTSVARIKVQVRDTVFRFDTCRIDVYDCNPYCKCK